MVFAMSQLSVSTPIKDFILEQNLFVRDGTTMDIRSTASKGSKTSDSNLMKRVISWELQDFDTGSGYRLNQTEVDKKKRQATLAVHHLFWRPRPHSYRVHWGKIRKACNQLGKYVRYGYGQDL